MSVHIYMKTHENILNILKVKIGHDFVTKNATFKVSALFKSSYCAYYLYEVS